MQWEFKACGRQIMAARAVDTATHPGYQRQGIFSNLTQCVVDAVTKDGLDLIFNTPNQQVLPGYLKLGWRYGTNIHPLIKVLNYPAFFSGLARYKLTRSRPQYPQEAFFHVEGTPFRVHMERREQIQDLVAQHDHLDQIRDCFRTRLSWDYLNWRYVNHPTIAYWSLVAGTAQGIQGCLVFRTNTRFGLKEVVVGELLLVRRDQELADSLLNQLQTIIRADYLVAHFATASFQHRALKQWGFRTLPRKGIDFTVKALSPNLPLQPEIFENWNLSLGDLEYF